jgi:hypothetical protein
LEARDEERARAAQEIADLKEQLETREALEVIEAMVNRSG